MPTNNGIKINALNNDRVALIAWELPGRKALKNCLGFALTRIDSKTGERTVLETKLPFAGQPDNRAEWKSQPSTVWPIQCMFWLDRGPLGSTVSYELVPMVGTVDNLKPLDSMKVVSNEVTFTTKVDDVFSVTFTNGTLSTQWLAHSLPTDKDGLPDWEELFKRLQTVGDPIRARLGGGHPDMMMEPFKRARAIKGKVLSNLYELAEPQMVQLMLDNIDLFSLILGNTGEKDETNAPARKALHDAGADITDRMLEGGIAHNKTHVLLNELKKALAVYITSANHTTTGWFCQANISTSIEHTPIAEFFADYFGRTKEDNAEQSAKFRAENAKGKEFKLDDGTIVEVYFAPNTPEKVKPKTNPATPPDMARVKELMFGAKDMIVGEVFYPGSPSVVHWAADIWNARPELYQAWTVSNPMALRGIRPKWRKGRPPLFTVPEGREVEFANFVKELLKLPEAHAITHGKIVVIDPFGDNPVVIFGSHNLGFKASYSNDENMVIVRGNKKFAQYVFVNLFELNSHYKARAAANAAKRKEDELAKNAPKADGNSGSDVLNAGGIGSVADFVGTVPSVAGPDAFLGKDVDGAVKAFDNAKSKVDPVVAAAPFSRGFLATTDDWQKWWLLGYKAREVAMLVTGKWDGTGLKD
ncbi:MAG: hypothetical protein K2X77_33655 [Candidatus Obscuribacterales bacterium]|nr:hypothetical protein [Candidatus Obscuribacterales bacterium]